MGDSQPEVKIEEKPLSMIEKAELAAKALKEQNDRYEALLKKQEELTSMMILGGRSEAGIVKPDINPEEKKKEEALLLLKGTGLNPFK